MSYQVLARKWRPRNFEQLVGQAHVARALVNALDADRLHHAFLFSGTRGVGKTTLARILAKCINCETGVTSKPCGVCSACVEIDEGRFVDLLEVDAASRSKVDETRDLMDNVQFSPARGRYKVYLIDEVHMFSEKSFNALLKTLEEPPPHVKFLLATTDPQKLPITVLSRCLKFDLKRLPSDDIAAHLERVLTEESIGFETAALGLVARAADGSMRDALSLLDQAVAYGAGTVTEEEARAMLGTVDRSRVIELLEAVAAHDAAGAMDVVAAIASDAADCSDVLGEMVNTLHRVAVAQAVPGTTDPDPDLAEACARLAGRFSPEDVQLHYEIGLRGRRDLALVPDPRLGLEMTVLRMLAFAPDTANAPPASTARSGGVGPTLAHASGPAAGTGTASLATMSAAVDGAAPPGKELAAGERTAAPVKETVPERIDPATLTAPGWRDLVEGLGLSGLEGELALNSILIESQTDRLKLELDPAHAALDTSGARERLRRALAVRLGDSIELDIALNRTSRETPAAGRARDEAIRRQDAIRAIEDDPRVRTLCETFGTSVDHTLVEPIDRPGDNNR
ncbi:MAG: DNA polymerase III subunit gamma/tau [Thiotrichales bacterium]|nr:DNA polymerase III subunit gamma/tau [Thiotrichales bacterium]